MAKLVYGMSQSLGSFGEEWPKRHWLPNGMASTPNFTFQWCLYSPSGAGP